MCNYVKFETGQNLLPVLKIVYNTPWARCVDISHCALLISTHVDRVFYFKYGSIILPGLWGSIGVTRSYSSRPFSCALVYANHSDVSHVQLGGLNHLIEHHPAIQQETENKMKSVCWSGRPLITQVIWQTFLLPPHPILYIPPPSLIM